MMDQDEDAAAALGALQWLRALCEEGRFAPTERVSPTSPPRGFDATKFKRGQRVATDNLFSLAYAELVSMLMMFAFEDQTVALLATGQSDTPTKAYFRYLSTMRRVRTWYEGDPWDPTTEAARNLKVVRSMHDQVDRQLAEGAGRGGRAGRAGVPSLHARAGCPELRVEDLHGVDSAYGLLPGPACSAAAATREAFGSFGSFGACASAASAPGWAAVDSSRPPAINQRAMAVTQVAFVGLFILEPARFGAHFVTDEDLEALVYVWWVLGRALGIRDCFNACGGDHNNNGNEMAVEEVVGVVGVSLRVARTRFRAVVGASVLPRLARVTATWQLMSAALCDGAALAAPGLSLPLVLATLVDVLAAVGGPGVVSAVATEHPAVERLMSLRDRAWRFVFGVVLGRAMRLRTGRALHNALFRVSLWVSQRAQRAQRARPAARQARALLPFC